MIESRILLITLILLTACGKSNYCQDSNSNLIRVNTSEAYHIEGTYCIKSRTSIQKDFSEISIITFDRITGKRIDSGMVFFGDSIKSPISSGVAEVRIPNGTYDIHIEALDHLSFLIEDFKFDSASVSINCFLGSSLQF